MLPPSARTGSCLLLLLGLSACGDSRSSRSDSGRPQSGAQKPVEAFNATNWDLEAGSLMVVALGEGDSVGIVLPQATDSSLPFQELNAADANSTVDLVGRAGKIASGVGASAVRRAAGAGECRSWPVARITPAPSGWRVGFTAGHVTPIPLDSIEGMPSADSASLAKAITQNVATLQSTSDSDFRGLPFRVRSAHTFRTDSIAVVIADVIRSVNEEANPRLEHFFVIGERPAKSTSDYRVAFFTRTAGAEDDAEVTELLAVVLIGPDKRPAAVVNIEYDEGGKLGMLERTGPYKWRYRWRSAYTGC